MKNKGKHQLCIKTKEKVNQEEKGERCKSRTTRWRTRELEAEKEDEGEEDIGLLPL